MSDLFYFYLLGEITRIIWFYNKNISTQCNPRVIMKPHVDEYIFCFCFQNNLKYIKTQTDECQTLACLTSSLSSWQIIIH